MVFDLYLCRGQNSYFFAKPALEISKTVLLTSVQEGRIWSNSSIVFLFLSPFCKEKVINISPSDSHKLRDTPREKFFSEFYCISKGQNQ